MFTKLYFNRRYTIMQNHHRFIMLLTILLCIFTFVNAATIQVGNPDQTTYSLPLYGVYGYSYSQQIFSSDQIGSSIDIIKLRFYYISGDITNNRNWTIYMGHTNQTHFSSNTDWVPRGSLTQVFMGDVSHLIPDANNWMEITLQVPFSYDNSNNLVLALHESTPGYANLAMGWGAFTSTANTGMCYYVDGENPNPNNPPAASSRYSVINSMQFMSADTSAPLAPQLVSPENNAQLMNGQSLAWILPNDSADASGFDVYIDGDIVVNDHPYPHYALENIDVGVHTWHVVARNSFGDSPASESRTINVVPGVIIGTGTSNSQIPIYPYFSYSYSQSIYLQSEINISDKRIDKIAYYWSGTAAGTNSGEWKVYMGHTYKSEYMGQSDWVPQDQMMLVFDGFIDIPAVEGWVEIILDTPFAYDNESNLVIAVDENTPGSDGNPHHFRSTLTANINRSMNYGNNFVNPDPYIPPQYGTLKAAYPNIMIQFEELPNSPNLAISTPSLDFGTLLNNTATVARQLMVANNGGGTLNLSAADISIIGTNADEFTFNSVNLPASLASGQHVIIPISQLGVSPGQISATLRIEYAGQNYDVELMAQVLPTNVLIIGDGTETRREPFSTAWGFERSAALYTADQINSWGSIDMIAWDCGATSTTEIPYKIWIKNTNNTTLNAATWQNMSSDMSMVKEGIHVPGTHGWQSFELDFPFEYTGNNLIVAVETNYGGVGGAGGHMYRFTSETANNHQFWNTDMSEPTGLGTLNGFVPNIMFHFSPSSVHDLATISLRGNYTPSVGISADYTVRIKNYGSSAQDNYSVKLLGPNNQEIASVAGPHLESTHEVDVVIPWVPSSEGIYSIRASVVLAGDENIQNNQTPPIVLDINPNNVFFVTVGDGSENARVPLDFYYKNSLYQAIYYSSELANLSGQITGLKLYTNMNTLITDKNIKVWMGTTNQQNLNTGWIPATELTYVFDGFVDFVSNGESTITIQFDEPFIYLNNQNLVLMFNHPMDTQYYTNTEFFKAQTLDNNRARNAASDNIVYQPDAPEGGILTSKMPKTTFLSIPGNVGAVFGTVFGADGLPLADVDVSINDGQNTTRTNAVGQYRSVAIAALNNSISFSKYGYQTQTQSFDIAENQELELNINMQLLPQVSVSGTILASDTSAGIAGAFIQLSGYNNYSANTDNNGDFTIPNVYVNNSYQYNIGAEGYSYANGQITVLTTDHQMGEIILSEYAYAPLEVQALVNDDGDAVEISWLAPDPDAFEVTESFESNIFPPSNWEQVITNTGGANALGVFPTWCRIGDIMVAPPTPTPTDGEFQVGLYWVYGHQDEWLITPSFNCPPNSYLRFDSYVYLGSTYGDHYYVKLSTDNGETWTVLWDASEQTGGWNYYASPITVDLSAYTGNLIKIAFQALDPDDNDGLYYPWFIDNIYIGNSTQRVSFDSQDMITRSASQGWQNQGGNMPTSLVSRARAEGLNLKEARLPFAHETRHTPKSQRALVGYKVYRLNEGDEQNEDAWTLISTEQTQDISFIDTSWNSLENGDYRWAVKAVYTNDVISVPNFSNALNLYIPTGMVAGVVRRQNNSPIAGATVTAGSVSATTNASGAYMFTMPVGLYEVTASADGFESKTVEDVIVNHNLTTTLNFILQEEESSNDEATTPVLATALNGNYPNPFNPETTISYSIKEPGKVKLQVFNIKGQLVKTLVDDKQATGHYKIVFNSTDNDGRSISSGMYLLKMSAPKYQKTSKMILMQ